MAHQLCRIEIEQDIPSRLSKKSFAKMALTLAAVGDELADGSLRRLVLVCRSNACVTWKLVPHAF